MSELGWKCHTPNLLSEILLNKGTETLRMPLKIFFHLLTAVATRAAQINDPELNLLMLRLTLYDVADADTHSADEIDAAYRSQRERLSEAANPHDH